MFSGFMLTDVENLWSAFKIYPAVSCYKVERLWSLFKTYPVVSHLKLLKRCSPSSKYMQWFHASKCQNDMTYCRDVGMMGTIRTNVNIFRSPQNFILVTGLYKRCDTTATGMEDILFLTLYSQ